LARKSTRALSHSLKQHNYLGKQFGSFLRLSFNYHFTQWSQLLVIFPRRDENIYLQKSLYTNM
jgi:hypothetical protein